MEAWLEELACDVASAPHERGRPVVTLAFALSADACLAETRGASTKISDEPSAVLTHRLRARHDAILVGVETAISDDPRLTTRLVAGSTGLRIVLDSSLRLPPESVLLDADATPPLIVATEAACPDRAAVLARRGAVVVVLPSSTRTRGVCLSALLAHLARIGVRSLMVEGGARVLESFVADGLVDHVCMTCSPARLGNDAAVRLSPSLEARVLGWRARGGATFGVDTVVAGRFEALEAARSPKDAS